MRRGAAAATGLLALLAASAEAALPVHPLPIHREGEVLVTWRAPATAAPLRAKAALGLQPLRRLRAGRVELLTLPAFMSTAGALAVLRDDPAVEHAEPNYLRYPRVACNADATRHCPDDPLFPQQWGLRNFGQPNFVAGGPAGVVGADLDMLAAWDPDGDGTFDRVGSPDVTIAIVDDSVFTAHEDLAPNIVAGHDFVHGDPDPNPDPGTDQAHGTLVAGAAGAVGNNGKGVAGTAWQARLMPLKFGYDAAGHIAALEFAQSHGADIVNASFGGPGFSQAELDAVRALASHDILYVAAAGNDDSNTDVAQLNYPANFDAPNVVAVAATNRQDAIASFSQYGALTVDVAAPGLQIVTTANGPAAYLAAPHGVSGTSFSAPYTAGVAALIRSVHPAASYGELRARLIEGGEAADGVHLRTAGGRVNAARSLDLAPRPALIIRSVAWLDGNQRLDPGETLAVDVTLQNLWMDATGVRATLTADNAVSVTTGEVALGDIAAGATATARFDLAVAGGLSGHRYVRFRLALAGDDGYAATRGFIAEIARLERDVTVTEAFAPRSVDLYDEFHAWHVDLPALPAGHDELVIETTSTAPNQASPDIDLLVKHGEPPRYNITVGINPETDSGFFCTSGTTPTCRDPATQVSAGVAGTESVVFANALPGTYHIVIVNFAQLDSGLDYTLRAYTRASTPPPARRRGGGLSWTACAVLLLGATIRAARRRP